MKLRTKALLAVSLGVALLLLLLQAVFSLVLMENFKSLEEQQVTQNLRRVQQALAEKSAAIPLRLIDWANWDDAYQFMEDHNQEFIDANLVTEGLSGLEMNFLLFFDRENRLFEAKSLDFRHSVEIPLPHELQQILVPTSPLLAFEKESSTHHGILIIEGKPLIFGVRPILTSSRTGPSRGALFWARFIDEIEVQKLRESLELAFSLRLADGSRGASRGLTRHDEHRILVWNDLTDFFGKPAISIKLEQSRDIYQQGRKAEERILSVVVVLGALYALFSFFVLQRTILKRIRTLASSLARIQASKDFEERLPTESDDELTRLAEATNQTLSTLAQVQRNLRDAKNAAESASAAKSHFVSRMSHEIRTPLNGILGMAHELQRTYQDPHAQGHLKVLCDCAESLMAVINDVLDFAKIEANKLELEATPFSLPELTERVLNTVRPATSAKRLELLSELDPTIPPWLVGDPTRLGQVLINLLGNAAKFTSQGTVKLKIARSSAEIPNTAAIFFEVQDTGPGISPEQQERVFDAFSQADPSITRRYGGTGLGLTISQQFVQAMGGGITLSSEMGRGTTFSFFLSFPIPHKEELKTGSGSERPPLFASSGPRRVLVVDDVATNRLVATNYLTELGHHPVAVSSGEDALKLYSSTQEAPFDLILLDLHMPGLSGSETAQRIRELKTFPTKKVPVVALTADTLRQDLMISHGGPFDEWLDKPLRIKDLELLTGRCGTTPSPTTSSPTQVDSFWLSATELDSQHLLTQYEDEPTIREMLLLFYEESEQLLTDYADALASSNSQSLKRAAHALKGSLYNAGALRLSACAEAIEHDPSRSLASPIPTVFMAEVKLLRSQLLANLTPPSNADVRA